VEEGSSKEDGKEKETYLDDAHVEAVAQAVDFGVRDLVVLFEVFVVIVRQLALGTFEEHGGRWWVGFGFGWVLRVEYE
jgi:hypothetical protein